MSGRRSVARYEAKVAAIAAAYPTKPGPRESTADDLLRMAAWNTIFGHVADAPDLERRIRELLAQGARL